MPKISEQINIEFVNTILQFGASIPIMLSELEKKGLEIAGEITSLEELDGEIIKKAFLRILLQCPLAPVLDEVKKVNLVLTGKEILPDFYAKIVALYKTMHPADAAILHPLCITHQLIRKTFGQNVGFDIQQICCRDNATGTVVHSQTGLAQNFMDEDAAINTIGTNACLYQCTS